MTQNDELLFADTDDSDAVAPSVLEGGWKLLIVDDEPEVHQITKLALVNFSFEGNGLQFLHAHSAEEAFETLKEHPDIAVTLLDVVMETDHAGLDLIKKIREGLSNRSVRIVLRTGQPGEAPEKYIISNYDINDYVEKAELTAQKLFTVVVASLRAYRDILNLENSRAELILANQHLHDERERIQVTLDSIGDAVLTTDAKGFVTHLNPVAESLTGWANVDAQGKLLTDVFKIINAGSRQPVNNPVEMVLTTGKIVGLANHTVLVSKDGSEYQIADSAAPIRNEAGEILGVILVCRDVTKEYQREEAFRRSQKMEAIGQLTGGIAHDFNNQLSVIIGHLDLLAEALVENTEAAGWVKVSSGATLRCTELTRQLLSFSRSESHEKNVVDINSKLLELEMVFARSVTPVIEIEYFLSEALWLTEIDPGEFQDAILNLVINARDAMPKGGKLIVETSNKQLDAAYRALNPDARGGEFVQLTLSDTGIGMDKVTQERIFEPFYTTKEKGKGTGLGMAMVYGFVKRFGGFIKIYSELGVGTTMRIYLPRSGSVETTSAATESDSTVMPVGNESILIVDDEVDLLHLAKKYLVDLGYAVHLAENADQAMVVFSQHPEIDLLFSDVVMPGGMNGYELAETLTRKKPQLKVLLTSGFTSNTVAQNGQQKFPTELLNKPYRKTELAQRVRRTLDVGDSQKPQKGRTVLVVEDDEDLQELFSLNLARLGYVVLQALNEKEALSHYQQSLQSAEPIDVVIMDLTLPDGVNGKDVAKKIRSLDLSAKIIVASGNSMGPEMTRYQEFGFQGALEKNFNRDTMKKVLEQVLAQGQ